MVSTAVNVREKLKSKKINAMVVNARFAKPIDFEMIDEICKKKINELVVLEEGVCNGGIGEAIENYVHDKGDKVKVKLVTLPDDYVEHGTVTKLRSLLKIDSDSVLKII